MQTERMRRRVELARALDLVPERIRQLERAGMPVDSVAAAIQWRAIHVPNARPHVTSPERNALQTA